MFQLSGLLCRYTLGLGRLGGSIRCKLHRLVPVTTLSQMPKGPQRPSISILLVGFLGIATMASAIQCKLLRFHPLGFATHLYRMPALRGARNSASGN